MEPKTYSNDRSPSHNPPLKRGKGREGVKAVRRMVHGRNEFGQFVRGNPWGIARGINS